jgi:hypothetical protein
MLGIIGYMGRAQYQFLKELPEVNPVCSEECNNGQNESYSSDFQRILLVSYSV